MRNIKYNALFEEIKNVQDIDDCKSVLRQLLDEVSDHENRIDRVEEDNDIESSENYY
jgi:hypothetical protein